MVLRKTPSLANNDHPAQPKVNKFTDRSMEVQIPALRWEFIKENKKVRKKNTKKTRSLSRILGRERVSFFSWSLFWSKECFLVFLLSFINSNLLVTQNFFWAWIPFRECPAMNGCPISFPRVWGMFPGNIHREWNLKHYQNGIPAPRWLLIANLHSSRYILHTYILCKTWMGS